MRNIKVIKFTLAGDLLFGTDHFSSSTLGTADLGFFSGAGAGAGVGLLGFVRRLQES